MNWGIVKREGPILFVIILLGAILVFLGNPVLRPAGLILIFAGYPAYLLVFKREETLESRYIAGIIYWVSFVVIYVGNFHVSKNTADTLFQIIKCMGLSLFFIPIGLVSLYIPELIRSPRVKNGWWEFRRSPYECAIKLIRSDDLIFSLFWITLGFFILHLTPFSGVARIEVSGIPIVLMLFILLFAAAGLKIWGMIKNIKTPTEKKMEAFCKVISDRMDEVEPKLNALENKLFNFGFYEGLRYVGTQCGRSDITTEFKKSLLLRGKQNPDTKGMYFTFFAASGQKFDNWVQSFPMPLEADEEKFKEGVKAACEMADILFDQVIGEVSVEKRV